jgi:membrane protein YqaA with SNARE-associated domain
MKFFGLYVQKSTLMKWLKIISFIAIVFFLYFNWDKVQLFLRQFVENVPFINNTLGFVITQLNERALLGLFLLSFFVNLFFISFPDEVHFITYLLAGHDPLVLIPVVAAGGLLGLTVDYVIGRVAGTALLRALMKQKYYKFKFASDKWGGVILVLGNLIPSPVQWFAVALGAFNYGYMKFIFFSAVGKLAKYIGLVFGFNYYTGTINPLINESFRPAIADFRQCLNQTNTTLPFLK